MLLLYALTRDSVLADLDFVTAAAAAAALPFAIAVVFASAIALARDRYEAYGMFQALAPVATMVLAVGLAVAFDVPGAAVGIAAATALTALAAWVWLARYVAVHESSERRRARRADGSGPRRGSGCRRGAARCCSSSTTASTCSSSTASP